MVEIKDTIPTEEEKEQRSKDLNISYHGNMSIRLGLNVESDTNIATKDDEECWNTDQDMHDVELETPVPTLKQKKERFDDLNFSYHGNMRSRMGYSDEDGINNVQLKVSKWWCCCVKKWYCPTRKDKK